MSWWACTTLNSLKNENFLSHRLRWRSTIITFSQKKHEGFLNKVRTCGSDTCLSGPSLYYEIKNNDVSMKYQVACSDSFLVL